MRALMGAVLLVLSISPALADRANDCANASTEGDPDLAITACTAQINSGLPLKGTATSYNNRGVAYMEKGMLDQAKADYDRAVSMDADKVVYHNRGNLFLRTKEYTKALSDFDAGLAIHSVWDKETPLARKLLGTSLEDAKLHYGRGLALAGLDRTAEALAAVHRAYEAGYSQISDLAKREIENLGGAITDTRQSIVTPPEIKASRVQEQARVFECESSDPDVAIKACTDLVLSPGATGRKDLYVLYNNRGLAYAQKGMREEALADYGLALAGDPNKFMYRNRAYLYDAQQEWQKALNDADAGLALLPKTMPEEDIPLVERLSECDDAHLHYAKGLALRGMGRPAEALSEFRDAFQMSVNDLNDAPCPGSLHKDAEARMGELNETLDPALHPENIINRRLTPQERKDVQDMLGGAQKRCNEQPNSPGCDDIKSLRKK